MTQPLIILLGDLHFGSKKNESFFLAYQKKFFDMFFSYLDDYKKAGFPVTDIIQLGDVLDNRQNLNFMTNTFIQDYFIKTIEAREEKWHVITGNHDTYLKSSLSISGTKQIFKGRKNIEIMDSPRVLTLHGVDFVCVPWICKENYDQCLNFINENRSKDRYLCGHFEIINYKITPQYISKVGIDAKTLYGYKDVFSGHFHTSSSDGYIHYVGTPYQINWNDYGNNKRFLLLNPKQKCYQERPLDSSLQLFWKLDIEDIDIKDVQKNGYNLPALNKAYIKVVVNSPVKDRDLAWFMNYLEETYSPRFLAVEDNLNKVKEVVELNPEEVDDPFSALQKTINVQYEDKPFKPLLLDYSSMLYTKALAE